MTLTGFRKSFRLQHLVLLPILGLAFYLTFIPHQDYPYPLHVDEWVHMADAKAMMRAGDTTFADPFSGESTLSLSSNLEAGFHLFWGVFQRLSGIPWTTIFRYFPSVIFVITVLSVYILAQREGFGWEAALFTCLIPTTVGILGPGFLVPVALGLPFIPLTIFLAFNFRSIWSYLLTFFFMCFLLAIHAPSAICLVIVLTPYILLNLRGNFKHGLGLALAVILPFLIIFPWISGQLLPTAKSLFTPRSPTEYVQLPRVIQTYGILPTLLCLLGIFVLVMRGGRKNYGLVLGLLALLVMLATFFTFHYGLPIMYERGLMYMMLMVSIVAGAGLMGVKNLRLPARLSKWPGGPAVNRYAGRLLSLTLIVITLFVAIPGRLNTPYYHMIDKEDYEAFVWIGNNINGDYEKAIVDPWKATAFTAITEKYIYTRIHAYASDRDNRAYAFIANGSSDTTFLRENSIFIVYTRVYDWAQNRNIEYDAINPDLVQVARNIYILKRTETQK